jgi:F0F1-type ATP synthase delta subunit
MLSRTAVANHAAKILLSGNQKDRDVLVEQLAAWLKTSGRRRQAKYLVNDIALKMSQKGYNLVSLTTAFSLSSTAKTAILAYLQDIYGQDASFEIVEIIDKNVVGGVLIDTPSGILDLTVKNKLMTIIKGV